MDITRITNENASFFLPEEAIPSALSDNSITLGSLTDDGEPAGYIIASTSGDGLFIDRVYTTPSLRRKGFAKGLIEKVCNLAGKSNIPYTAAIMLLTDEETADDPAYLLFKDSGFEEEDSPSCRKAYDLEAILAADPFKKAKLPKSAVYVPDSETDTASECYGGTVTVGGKEAAHLTCIPFHGSALITELRSDGRSLSLLSYLLKETASSLEKAGIKTVYADLSGENIIRFVEMFTENHKIETRSSAQARIMIREVANE